MHFNYEETPAVVIPEQITKLLKFGMTDPEVKILQEKLKVKGLFPSNTGTTEYFGSITKKAVKEFQTMYGLVVDGIVGSATRLLLNK